MCQVRSLTLWCPDFLRRLALVVLLASLAGCGFQLRGTDLAELGSVQLSGVSGDARRALVDAFAGQGITVESAASEGIRVRVEDQRSIRRPVATSASIDAAQYELRIELDYHISKGSTVIAPLTTIAAERIYAVDSLNLSGSYEEQQLLLAEMQTDLAGQIIQRIESWVLVSKE